MKKTDISWNKCKSIVKTVYKECAKPVLFWSFLFLFLYLLLDFYNIPSFAGFRIKDINTDLLGITVGAITAFLVFFYTYRFVERWNIKKNNNKKNTALLLLHKTYENCVKEINFWDERLLKNLANYEFNSNDVEHSRIYRYAISPFNYDEMILQYLYDGVLPAHIAVKYYEIKQVFISCVILSAFLYDEPKSIETTKKRMIEQIKEAFDEINQENKKVAEYYAYNRKTI